MKLRYYLLILLLLLITSFYALGQPIAIYGDTRSNDLVHSQVVKAIAAEKPIAAFHTGDLVSQGKEEWEWAKFDSIAAPLLSIAPFYPVLGNHEKDPELFCKHFKLANQQTWYTVTIDDLYFIMLDSNKKLAPGSEQFIWLENELKTHQDKQLLALFHHPIYSSGPHGGQPAFESYLVPLFEKYHVKATFSAHDHMYEKSMNNGIYYITTAGGGAPLYTPNGLNTKSVKLVRDYHYMLLYNEQEDLLFRVWDLQHKLIDEFRIPKTK